MTERNFDEEFDYASRKGLSFVLGGHTFHTLKVVPPGAFLRYISADDRSFQASLEFLRKVLIPDDVAALDTIMEDPNPTIPVTVYQLNELISWLAGELSGRPTTPPSSSGDGDTETSSGSKGKLSAVGGTGSK